MTSIEGLRSRYENQLLLIDGVVGVGTEVGEDGEPRLRILTSAPDDEVRSRLPAEIRDRAVLFHVGEIEAQ